MHAVHIVPRTFSPGLMEYIIGAGSRPRLDAADNCLVVYGSVVRGLEGWKI
jgi:hypothetical protein